MQRRNILIGAVIIALLCTVIFAIFLSTRSNDEYKIVEEPSGSSASDKIISLDTSHYPKLLSGEQQSEIKASILKRTSYNSKKTKSVVAVVRKDSLEKPSESEQTFIIDVESIQTSYLVSVYDDPNEGVAIINILCLPKEQQKYSKDYCHET